MLRQIPIKIITPTELDSSTFLLFQAINENDIQKAKEAIEKKADIHVCIKVHGTFLQLAISKLNYFLIKLLLEKGIKIDAPTINNESLVETVFQTIGLIIITQKSSQNGFQFSFYKKNSYDKLHNETILLAERILDLLLCYGLSTHIQWTELFKKSNKVLASIVDRRENQSSDIAYSLLTKEIAIEEAKLNSQKKSSWLLKNILLPIDKKTGEFHYERYLKIKNKDNVFIGDLNNFIKTIDSAKDVLTECLAEIEKEKCDCLLDVINQFNTILNYSLPNVILNIILEYGVKFEVQGYIAEKRLHENRVLQIWEDDAQKPDVSKEQIEFIGKRFAHVYHFFEGKFNPEAIQLIGEYAVENPNNLKPK